MAIGLGVAKIFVADRYEREYLGMCTMYSIQVCLQDRQKGQGKESLPLGSSWSEPELVEEESSLMDLFMISSMEECRFVESRLNSINQSHTSHVAE